MPVLTNLFGTADRIALGMGRESADELREIGELLAYLKEPEPPKGLKDAWEKFPILKKVMHMNPKLVKKAACQQIVISNMLARRCRSFAYVGLGGYQRS